MANYLSEALKHGRRPTSYSRDPKERKLARNLASYTSKSHDFYDPIFDKRIRELRPDWFRKRKPGKNKKELLELAKSGAKRPSRTEKLGSVLASYTCKSACSYDPVFDKRIRELRPDWFRKRKPGKNKKELLELARSGAKRPSNMAKDPEERRLGNALINYISKNRTCDPIFDKKIRKLRPDWFINTADLRKEELLKLAKSGAKRPSRTAKDPEERKLGQVLHSYLDKSHGSYDPVFDKKIRRLRPDWFRRRK